MRTKVAENMTSGGEKMSRDEYLIKGTAKNSRRSDVSMAHKSTRLLK